MSNAENSPESNAGADYQLQRRRSWQLFDLFFHLAPAKGGRGNKGGVSEEARQMGISEATARRRKARQTPQQ
jgi:hypothetical protein